MARVLIAPDKFKGSLTAAEVVDHLGRGLRARRTDVEIVGVPVADGGDGTLAAAEAAGFVRVPMHANGPTGRPVATSYARRDHEAVVEMADVSGLAMLAEDELDPMRATSRGVGEVIATALDAGCRRIVVGIGGSASTDGGAGMLQALGVRILGAEGESVPPGGVGLLEGVRLDLSGLHPAVAQAELVIACDVDNPLTGPHGAAAVYGPQKGAGPGQVLELDDALTHWADLVTDTLHTDHRDVPGAGAAGGVGFGALAVLGASMRPGAELVFELVGLPEALDGADLVITGEGSLDEQTLNGKAPAAVAAEASRRGLPVVAVAGRCTLSDSSLRAAGITTAYALTDMESYEGESFEKPGALLEQIGAEIAERHLVEPQ